MGIILGLAGTVITGKHIYMGFLENDEEKIKSKTRTTFPQGKIYWYGGLDFFIFQAANLSKTSMIILYQT
jgi:hypothetical protein